MRDFANFRKSVRLAVLKRTAEPDTPRNTTKRKKFTGSYSDLMNLPSAGTQSLQGADGKLIHLADYDKPQ